MNELELFMTALEKNNNLNQLNGRLSGTIPVQTYLYGDTKDGNNLRVFTRTDGIREMVKGIDRRKLLDLIRSKLIKEAIIVAEQAGLTVDNKIIDRIIGFASEYINEYSYEEADNLKKYIDDAIISAINESITKENVVDPSLGSDVLMNALSGNVRIMGRTNLDTSERIVAVLEQFDQMIDPNVEQRIVFNERSGR